MRYGFGKIIMGLTIGAAISLAAGTSFATDGDIMIGPSAKSAALGGATTAVSPDSTAILTNPAGLSYLKGGGADIGAALFSPPRKAYYDGKNVKSNSNLYTMPASGIVINNGGKFSFGIGAYGISGMGVDFPQTHYPKTGPNGSALTNMGNVYSNLEHMEFGVGVGYKVNNKITIGFTPIMVYQSLQMDMPFANNAYLTRSPGAAITPFTLDQESALGTRFAAGINYKPNDQLVFGLAYKSKSFMGKFKWNTDHFDTVKMKLESPRMVSFGVSYAVNPKLRFEIDEKFINYKNVMNTVNITTNISDKAKNFANYSSMIELLNDSKSGAVSNDGKTFHYPFKWKNQWVTAVGVAYKLNRSVTLRGGFNYAKNPIRNEYLLANITAMAIVETHVSAGVSYKMTKHTELTVAYIHAFSNTENNSDKNTQGMLKSLKMHQDTMAMEFSYLF